MAFKFLSQLAQALQKNKTTAEPADSPAPISRGSTPVFGVGALIDQRYRLDAEIGRGGMGIVYRAYDIQNQREVAIKVISFNELNTLSRQQFSREAQITARLNHPHIIAVYETGTVETGASEPSPFIVMELVRGESLDDMRGFTYPRIIDLGEQICAALAYAHNQGFVHRDLKPGNVLIEKRGFQVFAKLADFGLARPLGAENLPSESNMAGSILYLAPEVIAGQLADTRSDLYALGAMLYLMITGRVPFSAFDEKSILAQHLEEAVAPPSQSRPDVPPALEAIVLRLLAKNPADRFASAQEVCEALGQVQLTQGTAAAHGNLPPLATDLSGCETEIARGIELLTQSQLVTVLDFDAGFAPAIGAQLTGQFADGVWLVELEMLHDPALVLPTVAAILGVRENPQRALTVLLIESLREKNLLLILNHCDHLRGACAQLIQTVIGACPDARILASSRQPFNLPEEKHFRAPASL
jgi:hypothetical protein